MIFKANVHRVMLASPSDVQDERNQFSSILDTWNARYAANQKAVLLPVRWETHSTPELGDRPQGIINKQLVQASDILVGVFWTRLGTDTGAAASGSVEEIAEFRSQNKPVLLYFSKLPVALDRIDLQQYERLQQFMKKWNREGLVANYGSISEFRELLLQHLWQTISQRPRSIRLENRGNLKDQKVSVKYDPKQMDALVNKLKQQFRQLTPQMKATITRSLRES